MKLEDLRNGMICITQNGNRYVYFDDIAMYNHTKDRDRYLINLRNGGYIDLDEHDSDMNCLDDSDFTIMEVYEMGYLGNIFKGDFESRSKTLIWKREELPEYTVGELEKIVGHKFKITP